MRDSFLTPAPQKPEDVKKGEENEEERWQDDGGDSCQLLGTVIGLLACLHLGLPER